MPDDSEYNEEVINQLAAVRKSGHCNMLDKPCIRNFAEQAGLDALMEFCREADNGTFMAHLEEMGRRR